MKHDGVLPGYNYLKKEIGHDLVKLYLSSYEIVKTHQISFRFLKNLNADIYQRILKILSDFALGDRYSNINILSQSLQHNDPISNWHINIDELIFHEYVSTKKKLKIDSNAKLFNEMLKNVSVVHYISETSKSIKDIEAASRQTGIQEAVAPYRQFFVLQMIRYWVELIMILGFKAQSEKPKKKEIPYFGEIFGGFFNNDRYLKSRKTWDKI